MIIELRFLDSLGSRCLPGRKAAFSIILSLVVVLQLSAQNRTVSGRVTSSGNGTPMPGASIVIKGTTNGTTSDVDGNYKLDAKSEDVLVFSFIGYTSKEEVV